MQAALAPLLGESVWHALTTDPTLAEVSRRHYVDLRRLLERDGAALPRPLQLLEVGAYAHTSGYMLAERLGVQATLLDVSVQTLKLGRRLAAESGLPEGVRRVAADFHDLPFEDGQFHVVYLSSSLHHAHDWQRVLAELERVLAPGGLLYLENEPCLRAFCFYKFRTNRPQAFTSFERALDSLGALRTIAEPYLGSRPETLFGMIENQTIPLDDLIAQVEARCDVAALEVSPEDCMGPLERELLSLDEAGMKARLRAICSEAAKHLGEVERGLGFGLPDEAEIETLCARVAGLLQSLPRGYPRIASIVRRLTGRRWPRRAGAHRLALARLFGAGVRILGRKRGAPADARGRLKRDYAEDDGVVLGFEPAVLGLIARQHEVFPPLQSAPEAELRRLFPAPEWELATSAAGLRSLVTQQARAPILAAFSGNVFLRLHAARNGPPYRVSLVAGERELAGADVFQSESFLLAGYWDGSGALGLKLSGEGRVGISYAGSARL